MQRSAENNPNVKEATTPTMGENSAADQCYDLPIVYECLNNGANVQSDYSALEMKVNSEPEYC